MLKEKDPNNEETALSEIKIEAEEMSTEDEDERNSDPEISKLEGKKFSIRKSILINSEDLIKG